MFRKHAAPRRIRVLATLVFILLGSAACASAPRFMGKTAQQLWDEAQADFAQGKFQRAIDELDWLIASFPEFPQAPDAQFLLARSYFEDEQYILASDEFQRMYGRYPTHALVPEAVLGVCRSEAALSPIPERDQMYTRRAAQACGEIARQYQAFPIAAEAARIATEMREKLAEKQYQQGQYYFQRKVYDSAYLTWEVVVDEFGDTAWAPRALLAIGRAYDKIGYKEEATEARQRLRNLYPNSPEAAEVPSAPPE
jgi:outer membrane protein assembly factor BamD